MDLVHTLDTTILLLPFIVILFLLEILTFATSNFSDHLTYRILGSALLLLTSHMVLIFYIFHKLAKKTGIAQYLKRRYKALTRHIEAARHTGQAEADVKTQSDTGSPPD